MPLDGHAYLESQGWTGKGTGLRCGAISKPIAVKQKKTLSGIGKDRDDAFPFWDHVFSAAANKIKVKLDSDSESESESGTDTPDIGGDSTTRPRLHRTSTGIISNRRPATGTPALSGTTTPFSDPSSSGTSTPRTMSILAAAKQEAARRTLYSMFFRGPVMRSDDMLQIVEKEVVEVTKVETIAAVQSKKKKKGKGREGEEEVENGEKKAKKKRKTHEREASDKSKSTESLVQGLVDDEKKQIGGEDRLERKRRKEDKRARKEERRRLRAERKFEEASQPDSPASGDISVEAGDDPPESQLLPDAGRTSKRKRHAERESSASKAKKKKKRKDADCS